MDGKITVKYLQSSIKQKDHGQKKDAPSGTALMLKMHLLMQIVQ